jgi:hypothetical protein
MLPHSTHLHHHRLKVRVTGQVIFSVVNIFSSGRQKGIDVDNNCDKILKPLLLFCLCHFILQLHRFGDINQTKYFIQRTSNISGIDAWAFSSTLGRRFVEWLVLCNESTLKKTNTLIEVSPTHECEQTTLMITCKHEDARGRSHTLKTDVTDASSLHFRSRPTVKNLKYRSPPNT